MSAEEHARIRDEKAVDLPSATNVQFSVQIDSRSTVHIEDTNVNFLPHLLAIYPM
jgi:hypothetical protein